MNSKIRDYKGEIVSNLERIKELNTQFDISSNFNEIYRQAKELLDRVEPSLMFYGVYNAGKSSLLNAVFGEMRASVADIPETHKVTYYKWGNFDLVDTPGINGPEADFVISKAELKKHDVIMFVIDDSDNFDSDFIAKEIVEIITVNKPLIIVLNNKQNSDKERFDSIRNKLYDNINKAAKLKSINNIQQKYEFIVVNSNMAYKGKTEDKQGLLKMSKIQELEIMITEQLRQIDEIKLLINPLGIILDSINSLNILLNERMVKSDEEYFTESIKNISENKNNHIRNLQSLISLEIRKYNEIIYSAVVNGNDVEEFQAELSNKINSYIDNSIKMFANECNTEFTEMIKKPEVRLLLSSVDKNEDDEMILSKPCTLKTNSELDTIEAIIDAIAILPMPQIELPTPVPIPVPVIVAVVKALISIFKKDKDNFEDIQTRVEEANDKQREAISKRMNAMQEARTQINIQLHKFEEESMVVAIGNITHVYEETAKQLKNLMIKATKELENFTLANNEINKIQTDLLLIKGELD